MLMSTPEDDIDMKPTNRVPASVSGQALRNGPLLVANFTIINNDDSPEARKHNTDAINGALAKLAAAGAVGVDIGPLAPDKIYLEPFELPPGHGGKP